MGLERADQAVLLEVAGPELEDQRAHLGERLALELAELGQLRPRRVRVAVEQHLDGARHQGHREQRLGDRVVQLAGEVRALLAGGELAGLAAQLALEADLVADVARRALDAGEPPSSTVTPTARTSTGVRRPSRPRRTWAAWTSWSGSVDERAPSGRRRSGSSSDSRIVPKCWPMSSSRGSRSSARWPPR